MLNVDWRVAIIAALLTAFIYQVKREMEKDKRPAEVSTEKVENND